MTNSQFNPALPLPIKWNISDDRFNEDQQVLALTIPVDSVTHLIDHLKNLVNTKAKQGEVYDFNKKEYKITAEKIGPADIRTAEQGKFLTLLINEIDSSL